MNKKGFTPTPIIKQKRPKNKLVWGFTLIEIIVATFVLALVITGLAYVFLAAKRHLVHTRSKIQGAELGRLFLAPLQMDVREDQWGNNCLSAGGAGCPGAQTVDNILYTPAYDISNVSGTTLRRVKVTLTWNEPAP